MITKYKFLDPEGIYFVSFATVGWVDVFTRAEYKEIFLESLKYCQQHKGLVIHAWCLMTNHVHLIFSGGEPGKHSGILRDLKKYTAIKLLEAIAANPQESRKEWMMKIFTQAGKENSNNSRYQFWRQDNHPVEIYSPKVVSQKLEYVHNNPVNAGIVQEAEHYLYSSARNYSNQNGLINVENLDIPGSLVGYVNVG
ncbi:MAG: transposase [Saprospiraceae bacterium]|nr:transposase [Saprospiraceae bacterium]HNE63840.1 transposase [Saprospiraceae bacterium]HNG70188.1 transposase [Saprospiraceae bacterium]HNL19667.1 transposase [Saprospiraceae bacterium]